MGTLLETKNLCKFFETPGGMLHAVDNVNLKIEQGTTIGIVGESGCGKSTLGRTLLRLIEPTSGEVIFNGKDVTKFKRRQLKQFRSEAQIIFQDPYASLNPRLSVSEIIAEPLIVSGGKSRKEIQEEVFKTMDMVGLAARLVNFYPHELDGGRRQRIGVARALIMKPKFVVCDEPVSALDVSIQAQILNLLMDLQDEMKLTYMFITHDLSVVRHISDEIMVMYLGRCVEKAPAKKLFANPVHPYTKALLSAIPVPDLSRRGKEPELLKGELKSPIDPEPGCRFAPRCQFAGGKCRGTELELKEIEPDHFAACINI